jgi:hypothetical protein
MPPRDAGADALALLRSLDKEELVQIVMDDARNWLAHDGLWFQAVESAHGMDEAIAADRAAWERFTEIEAQHLGPARPGGGRHPGAGQVSSTASMPGSICRRRWR